MFEHTRELFFLVPILFNLKGNLEMNLASRLSTAVGAPLHPPSQTVLGELAHVGSRIGAPVSRRALRPPND